MGVLLVAAWTAALPKKQRIIMRFIVLVATFVLLAMPVDSESRWGPSGCAATEPVGSPVAKSDYAWKQQNETQWFLYLDGKCVGGWDTAMEHYLPWDGSRWQPATKPPIDRPNLSKTTLEAWQLNGVKSDELNGHNGDSFNYCGLPVTKDKAFAAVEGKDLPDDSNKMHFIILTRNEETRAKLVADYAMLPEGFRNRCHLHAAHPDHWSMKDRDGKPRFNMEQDPTIELLDSKGIVLCRHPRTATEQGYQGFKDMQAVLKSDPNHKKELDPGLPGSGDGGIPLPVLIGAGVVGVAVIRNRSVKK
jgi:hypothetical protein